MWSPLDANYISIKLFKNHAKPHAPLPSVSPVRPTRSDPLVQRRQRQDPREDPSKHVATVSWGMESINYSQSKILASRVRDLSCPVFMNQGWHHKPRCLQQPRDSRREGRLSVTAGCWPPGKGSCLVTDSRCCVGMLKQCGQVFRISRKKKKPDTYMVLCEVCNFE